MTAIDGAPAAAWVDGDPITVEEVDARLAALRATQWGSRLPAEYTAEGRNARRWVVQLLAARRVVEREVARRGIATTATRPLRLDAALAVGGVAAAVLAEVPGAVELADSFGGGPAEDAVRDYYDRNRDLYGDAPFEDVRARIAAELAAAGRDREFALWLEQRMRDSVRTAPGFEHPATPGSPDATHRH